VSEVAADPDGLLGEPAEELGRVPDLATGLGERFAHLQGDELGELLDVREDRLVRPVQDLAALAGRRPAPLPLHRDGRGHRGPPVGRGAVGDRAQDLTGRRVHDLGSGTVRGAEPPAADEKSLVVQHHAVLSRGYERFGGPRGKWPVRSEKVDVVLGVPAGHEVGEHVADDRGELEAGT
jgi:hypothetical protein